MPTPLPAITPPDFSETLNAFRLGQQDKLAADKRKLMQDAGGLAAAGNYKGAMGALYKGGEFGEARSMAGEIRSQSAEARAAANHARTLSNDQLERATKGQELMGRLAGTIQSPEQLEQAKALLRQRGINVDGITMEQLPMLRAQGLSVQQALENERDERKMLAEQQRLTAAQADKERDFAFRQQEAQRAQANADRTFGENQRQFGLNQEDQAARLELDRQKAAAVQQSLSQKAAAAALPKPPTVEQAKTRGYLSVMEDASAVLKGDERKTAEGKVEFDGVLNSDAAESPMSSTSNYLATTAPDNAITSSVLNKREKQYMQATMQWVRAKLRKESGATISPDEFAADYRVYFPQPGDDVQTRRNKARARRKVEEALRVEGNAVMAPQGGDIGTMSDEDILKELSK